MTHLEKLDGSVPQDTPDLPDAIKDASNLSMQDNKIASEAKSKNIPEEFPQGNQLLADTTPQVAAEGHVGGDYRIPKGESPYKGIPETTEVRPDGTKIIHGYTSDLVIPPEGKAFRVRHGHDGKPPKTVTESDFMGIRG